MSRGILLGALLLAGAACAPAAPPADIFQGGTAKAAPKAAIGPQVIVRIPQRGQVAKTLIEQVGARCWLDGITQGAQMFVDRQTGRIVIVGETSDLLAADFLPPSDERSRIRLSGPVVGDPAKASRLVETLDIASRTGKTDCPIAAG